MSALDDVIAQALMRSVGPMAVYGASQAPALPAPTR